MLWKAVCGFEGYYEVSDHGNVRSVQRTIRDKNGMERRLRSHPMKITRTRGRSGDGYYVVNLRKNGKSYVMCVHSIVATAFLPNPLNLPTVNHKNGNKANNSVWNLEWASYADNNMHAIKTGLRHPRGTAVLQIDDDGEVLAQYKSVCAASRETGIGRSMISHCINGRVALAGGYTWQKLSEGVTTIP